MLFCHWLLVDYGSGVRGSRVCSVLCGSGVRDSLCAN